MCFIVQDLLSLEQPPAQLPSALVFDFPTLDAIADHLDVGEVAWESESQACPSQVLAGLKIYDAGRRVPLRSSASRRALAPAGTLSRRRPGPT